MKFSDIRLPNIRKLFAVDPDHTQIDADLKGADAQVVAAEAHDEDLLAAFAAGLDVHAKNAEDMFGTKFTQASEGGKYSIRRRCKSAVHGTNYGGSPYALARTLGWTVHESELFQRKWFSLHPRIHQWQKRIMSTLKAPSMRDRAIWNKWGNRIYFTDRVENNYKKALAWIPQSTIAQTTFKAALRVEETFPEQISRNPRQMHGFIMQVHDSLVFQVRKRDDNIIPLIIETLHVAIPYDPPLIIPWDVKTSRTSWGEAA